MRLCINCYTENPDDVVYCSQCGMSLMGAPTPEEARKLAEERRRRRKQPLTASGIVYLFADHFVTPWAPSTTVAGVTSVVAAAVEVAATTTGAALAGGVVGYGRERWQRRHWSVPVQVPYSDQHVAVRDLGRKLLEAAFVSLAQEGYISLSVEKTKTLFASQEVVTIKREKEGNDLPPSLERLVMELLAHSPQRSPLMRLVTRVAKAEDREIGGEDRLLGGKDYYCDGVAYVVMKALTDMGWLRRGGPVKEAAPLVPAMAGLADTAKARLESFAGQNPDLHARLISELMQLA
jgi:hypothetical protein